ncbi:hypothetical protein ACH4UY_04905 [Streptomyces longwoodensis]|uniref:hypothetical protein n=1 Tax=Streptomyces longwoodensis TaxID=68231 RepID=UPI00379D481A
MAAQVSLPVYVRVGETEGRWGEITIEATDGALDVATLRREVAAFFRAAADDLENPATDDEEVPDAAP